MSDAKVIRLGRCDTPGCEQRAVVWFMARGFCADCQGHVDADRARVGLPPMLWRDGPVG